MDQRQLVRSLEEHFRKEDEEAYEQRKRVHAEREAVSDDEWWAELIELTKNIRPTMLEVFERNKVEMISKRFETIQSEEGFREKSIQRRAMDLLPYVSSLRADHDESGPLTEDQISLATLKMEAANLKLASQADEKPNKAGKRFELGEMSSDQLSAWILEPENQN